MSWYNIKAASKPKTGELRIYGFIEATSGGLFGSDSDVTPAGFADDLKALGDVEELNIYISSYGGDPLAAHAIHAMLKRHSAKKTVYIDGIAASAASLIAMAGDKIIMPLNAMLMVHAPWGGKSGTATEHRQMADTLDRVGESMAATYQEKTGLPMEEIQAIMSTDSWFDAKQAVEKGFADEIDEDMEVAASLTNGQATINGQVVDISQFKNFPQDKLEAIASATQARAEQAAREERKKETEAQARHRARLRDLDVMELRH